LKDLKALEVKYKNMKAAAKKNLAKNAMEMKKTGGGTAQIELGNSFNISETQIDGLQNKFDSDFVDDPTENESLGLYDDTLPTRKRLI
jgi:hypothetical protein